MAVRVMRVELVRQPLQDAVDDLLVVVERSRRARRAASTSARIAGRASLSSPRSRPPGWRCWSARRRSPRGRRPAR